MPTSSPKRRTPKLRRHSSGQGFVQLNGKRIYLGRYDDPATREQYHRLIAEWEANGQRLPPPPEGLTVVELIDRYSHHVDTVYQDAEGRPTPHAEQIKANLKPVRELYGRTAADDFGPRALKTVRQQFIDRGIARPSINSRIGFVKGMFAWGVEEELVSPSVHHALAAVRGLRKGRCGAKEPAPVKPVPEADVEATKPALSRQVAALVDLQRLTAARGGELVILRPTDIDTSGDVWVARPEDHKSAHHGKRRAIWFGPEAQRVLAPFLAGPELNTQRYLFSPAEAEAERREKLHAERETYLSSGNRPGSNRRRRPQKQPGERYTSNSYRRAIERACRAQGVALWSPHRLRHTAATRIRKKFGLEAAQIMLGHAWADVTQVYAEVDEAKAVEIAKKIG